MGQEVSWLASAFLISILINICGYNKCLQFNSTAHEMELFHAIFIFQIVHQFPNDY